jgi:hypothetical protein
MEDKPTMIKRCFSICVLLIALALPAFGGHVRVGGVLCEGDCIASRCNMCGAECSDGGMMMAQGETKDTSSEPPASGSLEDGLFILALLFMVYRLRL